MLRVCVALFLSSCAFDEPAPRHQVVNAAQPKITPAGSAKAETGTEKIPPRQCTTIKPIDDEVLCRDHKYCKQNPEMTCAEAFYRLTHCARVANEADRHRWLDGGAALRKDDQPNKSGQPNGIPCQGRCGGTALEMKRAIAANPFFPPTTTTTNSCNGT
jgi:hypothetical protein